jgi:5'-nucleotidase
VLWTRQSVRHYEGYVAEGVDPMGRTHYWFAEEPTEQVEEGTDRWAIENGYVSMTPLRLDLTDEVLLARARAASGQAAG